MLGWLAKRFESIPLIGGLTQCSWQDHVAAVKEFVPTALFATATFWLSAWILMFLTSNSDAAYLDLLKSTINGGELLIFAVGFIGTAFVLTNEEPIGSRRFPGKLSHSIVLVILMILCASAFAFVRLAHGEVFAAHVNRPLLVKTSVWLAALALLLRYLAVVYRKSSARHDEQMKQGEKAFAGAFAKRHAGDGHG